MAEQNNPQVPASPTIRYSRVPTAEEVAAGVPLEEIPNSSSGKESNAANPKTSSIPFPPECLVGSIGEYARLMSEGSEVPPEFFFAAGLTMVGALAATRLRLTIKFPVEPRLYTILLGESYRVKKSTALNTAADFFERIAGRVGLKNPIPMLELPISRVSEAVEYEANHHRPLEIVEFDVISGSPGSAEGLMRRFYRARSIVLVLDELKMLLDKAAITGSSLLSAATSLFEKTKWESPIKSKADSSGSLDAHLSIASCCTLDTYENVWTREALAIGLTNRIFVVTSDAKAKYSWPRECAPTDLATIEERIIGQLRRLPMKLDITPEGFDLWDKWYQSCPETIHARRLETIGFRLLALVALTTDKTEIDAETIDTVIRILDYEYSVRVLTDPIDATAVVAKLEEKIRRVLDRNPAGLDDRVIRQKIRPERDGLWAYKAAKNNLCEHGDMSYDPKSGLYRPRTVPPPAA